MSYDKPVDVQKLIEKAEAAAIRLAELELSVRATISMLRGTNQELIALRDELTKDKVVCGQCGTVNLPKWENCISCGSPL